MLCIGCRRQGQQLDTSLLCRDWSGKNKIISQTACSLLLLLQTPVLPKGEALMSGYDCELFNKNY